jgi:hypothetical protein
MMGLMEVMTTGMFLVPIGFKVAGIDLALA